MSRVPHDSATILPASRGLGVVNAHTIKGVRSVRAYHKPPNAQSWLITSSRL
jgi:hypothetical protein